MWNKWRAIWREPSSKRLVAALLVSVLLHLWLAGGLHLKLPALNREVHTIEARLQKPKANIKQDIHPQTQDKKIVSKPKKTRPIENLQAQEQEVVKKLEKEIPSETQEVKQEENDQVTHNSSDVTPMQRENAADSQSLDEGLVINENAYTSVRTNFDVRTQVDGPVQGKASIVFSLGESGVGYSLKFTVQAQGLAGLFVPDLTQVSQGELTKYGLRPSVYTYQFGDKADKSRKAVFDWQNRIVEVMTSKESKIFPLADDTQDVLSFMYQFMYVAPLQKMQLSITNGKNLKEYDYDFVGDETLVSVLGNINAYHIVHNNSDTDEKIELWLARDYQFVPIKIRKIEKDGKMYEFTATRLITAGSGNQQEETRER